VAVTVSLLADCLSAADAVASMRWQEWGHPPEAQSFEWWLETTVREAGRDELPVTFVARGEANEAVGAVGLDTYDLDERHDTSPWVTGMIVRRDRRGQGVGRALMQHLDEWAADRRIAELWVGTDLALGFYQRCGWTLRETFTRSNGQHMDVLHKRLL
jgi:GNAT superfamily N-acetyltransferase